MRSRLLKVFPLLFVLGLQGMSVAVSPDRTRAGTTSVEVNGSSAGGLAATSPAESVTDAGHATAASERTAREERIESAVNALVPHVAIMSDPDALRLALRAYYNFMAAHTEQVRNHHLYYVDYGLDNRTPRGYVFDMETLALVDGPFTVAHGRGSSRGRNAVPTKFSNAAGSAATSLGLYLTQETYRFTGHSGGRIYHSIGLRLRGVSGRFNSAARDRGVVVHGAPYVTVRDAGRSEGCPAMQQSRAKRLIPLIADGALVFLFSPEDRSWVQDGPWIQP